MLARNKYPEKTRQAILEAAVKLFTIRGWEKVTIQEVIDEVGGITRGAFYHHFKSKAELIDAVTDEYFSENTSVLSDKNYADTKAVTRLRKGIEYTLEKQTEEGELINISSVINSPEFVFRIVHDSIKISSKEIAELIHAGNNDGSWFVEDTKEVSEIMMLLFNIWINPNIIEVSKEEFQQKIFFFDKLLKQLGLPLFDENLRAIFMSYYEKIRK